jgi:hypothetical protein
LYGDVERQSITWITTLMPLLALIPNLCATPMALHRPRVK